MGARQIVWAAGLALAVLAAGSGRAAAETVEVNLLFVHGLKDCQAERQNAQNTFIDLEAAINAELPPRIAGYQAAHPGTTVVVRTARANLYTATPSGFHPSDSPNPLNMDDWEVGDPGCTTTKQGDPCTTAYEWRYRLAQEIIRLYPAPTQNIILIGHSNGGRVIWEVTANDSNNSHNATFWWKTRSERTSGPDLISSLPAS